MIFRKWLLVCSLVMLLIGGCTGIDQLYHVVDQFEYLVTMMDLANATINLDFEMNWDALYRLEAKYGVDIAGPAAAFLVAAQDLQEAVQQLQIAIEQQYQSDVETRALRKTLRRIDPNL